ncbi:unnamed protein product, partial [Brenthis ino]
MTARLVKVRLPLQSFLIKELEQGVSHAGARAEETRVAWWVSWVVSWAVSRGALWEARHSRALLDHAAAPHCHFVGLDLLGILVVNQHGVTHLHALHLVVGVRVLAALMSRDVLRFAPVVGLLSTAHHLDALRYPVHVHVHIHDDGAHGLVDDFAEVHDTDVCRCAVCGECGGKRAASVLRAWRRGARGSDACRRPRRLGCAGSRPDETVRVRERCDVIGFFSN